MATFTSRYISNGFVVQMMSCSPSNDNDGDDQLVSILFVDKPSSYHIVAIMIIMMQLDPSHD